jgi:DNA polymerase III sliding clamp (beta) subunit (PCNA family)
MKTQLNILKKASQKSALPVIDKTVLVTSTQLLATNLDTFIQVSKPENLTVNGSGVISFDFLKSLENCRQIAITFHGLSAEIIADGRIFTVSALSEEDYPVPADTVNMMHEGQIIGQNLASVLDFTSKNDYLNREQLTGVYIGSDIVGCNGHYMRWIKSGYDGEPFILRREAVEAIKEQAKTVKMYQGPAQFWNVKTDKNAVCVYNETAQIICRKFEPISDSRVYPDYNSVIPQGNEGTIKIDMKQLKNALKDAKRAYNKTTKQVVFDVTTEQTITLSANDEYTGTAVNIPINAQTQNIETGYKIGFNAGYLDTICSNVSSDYLDISLSTPNRAAIINENILLMPVMIKG